MKVALVSDWYAPRVGGIELHLSDLAARLTSAGHDVVVVTPTPGPAVVNGTRVVRVDASRAPRFGFLITRAGVRAVGAAVAAERPDVVHSHVSIVSPAALGAACDADRHGLPLVVTFHSFVPQTQFLARRVGRWLGAGRWLTCFSAVSGRVARDVQPFAPDKMFHRLPNGVDVDFWRATSERTAPRRTGTTRLISVMRLNAKKRPIALVGLMRRLRRTLDADRRVELRIVGDGPWRLRVERAIRRAGLSQEIELLGHQSRERIRELFAESDVFVLPTVRESFGLAALEARCAGLPIVAMRDTGVAEFVRHGVHGLLAGSDDELAAHVGDLVTRAETRTAMAARSSRTIPPFDWANVVDEHLLLYRKAIALRSLAIVPETRLVGSTIHSTSEE